MRDDLLDRLSRARLVDDGPCTRAEIAAAEARIVARAIDRTGTAPAETCAARPDDDRRAASGQLTTLCETVVTHAAFDRLEEFLAQAMPEPDGALLLGCLLQLTDGDEAARFWWQYAAGAGERTAGYCLYLHHLSLGEVAPASWWYVQQKAPVRSTEPVREPAARLPTELSEVLRNLGAADASLDTTLRVLNALRVRAGWRVPAMVCAVLDYIPAAVAWVDEDVELPLPEPGFTERIRTLTGEPPRSDDTTRGESDLPARPRSLPGGIASAARRRCAR
ncbi:hypothetical protein ACFWIA_10310 [Streptomyces sp. NPDC127068]|uniref:hypothetical protein n=1 Tax=Streptomyces sp. NPDC127068 TaxID=3347127 RepID=UPI00365EB598